VEGVSTAETNGSNPSATGGAAGSTATDAVADGYVDAVAALDPFQATFWGVPGHDEELPGWDPDWYAQMSQLRRDTLAKLADTEPSNANDRITTAALRDRLEISEQLRGLGEEEGNVRVIASPVQDARDIFDLMSTATVEHWATIA